MQQINTTGEEFVSTASTKRPYATPVLEQLCSTQTLMGGFDSTDADSPNGSKVGS